MTRFVPQNYGLKSTRRGNIPPRFARGQHLSSKDLQSITDVQRNAFSEAETPRQKRFPTVLSPASVAAETVKAIRVSLVVNGENDIISAELPQPIEDWLLEEFTNRGPYILCLGITGDEDFPANTTTDGDGLYVDAYFAIPWYGHDFELLKRPPLDSPAGSPHTEQIFDHENTLQKIHMIQRFSGQWVLMIGVGFQLVPAPRAFEICTGVSSNRP